MPTDTPTDFIDETTMEIGPPVDSHPGPRGSLSEDIDVPGVLTMVIARQMIGEVDLISQRALKWTPIRGFVAATLLT